MTRGQSQTVTVAIADQFGRTHKKATNVEFSATAGSLNPINVTTATGSASTTYLAPNQEGPAFVTIKAGDAATIITINVAGGGLSGDANGDGQVTSLDVVYLINHLFNGGPAPVAPTDVNGDGTLTAADVIYLVNYLFANGTPPK